MNYENFDYKNKDKSFCLSYRKAESHNMPANHFHSSYELFYLINGSRNFFIKDRVITIREGDLVLIHPNILHKTMNSFTAPHERIIINFDPSFAASPVERIFHQLKLLLNNEYTIINLSHHDRIQIEELFVESIEEIQHKKAGYELYLSALLLQLLIYCNRYEEKEANIVKPQDNLNPIHRRILDIVRYINKNYSHNLTLQSLSEAFYISQYYLSRVFKEVTGFTLTEYINSVRVKEAKKLLEESQLKVKVIAEKVGFGSITHFGRVFKEITGHAPLYYRKTRKENK